MTKFLLIGDPHFKKDNKIETDILKQEIVRILLDDEEIKHIVIMGDLLHEHDQTKMSPYNRAINFCSAIVDTGRTLYLLVGNHDRSNNSIFLTDDHFFNA